LAGDQGLGGGAGGHGFLRSPLGSVNDGSRPMNL
jgi:hypothetical protein